MILTRLRLNQHRLADLRAKRHLFTSFEYGWMRRMWLDNCRYWRNAEGA